MELVYEGVNIMKKKLKIILILIIILIIVFSIIYVGNKNKKSIYGIDIANKKILIKESGVNFAWKFTHSGTIICEDGSIYKYEVKKDEDLNYSNKLEKRSKEILKILICKV